MTIECAQFEFTTNTSTGTQTIVSGLSFTVKAYILFSTYNTSDATYQDHSGVCIGFSDGTDSRCIATFSEDAQGTTDAGKIYGPAIFARPSTTAPDTTADAVAQHSSFGSGTIVINWTDAPSAAYKVYGMCWGGADLQAKVVGHTTEVDVTGNHSYTGAGFQPEIMFTLMPEDNETPLSAPFQKGYATLGFGCGVSSSKRFLVSIDSEDGSNSADTWRFASNSKVVGCLRDTTGAYSGRAFGDLTSLDSDGCTINWEIAPHQTDGHWFALYMAGGDWDIVQVAKRTSTGDTVISPSVNTIKGIIAVSHGTTQSDTANASNLRFSAGVASSTSLQGGCWTGDLDAADPTAGVIRSEDSNILIMAVPNATATSSTTEALASITAMSTTATLTYTTANATAADIFFIFCGEVTTTTYQRTINESSISISDSIVRKAKRPITESAISISDSIVKKAFKTITETAVSIADDIDLKIKRPIAESAISISDVLTRNKVSRLITESAVSIVDSILLKIKRPITESSVSIADSITRIMIFSRTIDEAAISIADSILLKVKRPISDSVSTTDSIVKKALKTINESSVSISDSIILLKIKRPITETAVSIADTLTRNKVYRIITEASISITDSIIKKDFRTITESALSISDSILLKIKRPIVESAISITDAIVLKIKRIINESTVSITDTLLLKIKRPITESIISISDTLTRNKVYRIITEGSTSITDSIIKKDKRTITESAVSISDSIVLKIKRVITEAAITTADNITRIFIPGGGTLFQRTITETAVTISDSLTISKIKRSIVEPAVNITDSITKKAFKIINESAVSISDSIIRKYIFKRTIDEPAISITDSIPLVKVIVAGGVSAIRYIGWKLMSFTSTRSGHGIG